jgi:hypothetical protein
MTMKRLMLGMIVATLMSAATLRAQEVAGTWQGTLQPPNAPKPLRLVMKITTEADQLKAVLYSIDQGGQPMNAGAVTFQSSTLKVALPAIGGSYEGRMSADGSSIVGTFNGSVAEVMHSFDYASDSLASMTNAAVGHIRGMALLDGDVYVVVGPNENADSGYTNTSPMVVRRALSITPSGATFVTCTLGGETETFEVEPASAWDAFEHPYCYGASLDFRKGGEE